MVDFYGILYKVGFDWQVALANTINFLIILFLLKKFAFKPIGKMIKDRQDKISEGIAKAKEAEVRLHEVDDIAKGRLQETDRQSIAMISAAQDRAKKLEESLVKKAEEKQQQLIAQAEAQHVKQQEESRKKVLQEAAALVKRLIVKTVGLKPEAIDEALIAKAAEAIKHEV